jgi:hypothetical protein
MIDAQSNLAGCRGPVDRIGARLKFRQHHGIRPNRVARKIVAGF